MLQPHARPPRVTDRLVSLIGRIITEYDGEPPLTERKINTITFLAEYEFRDKHGEPLTGIEFVKYSGGPSSKQISDTIEALERHGHVHSLVRTVGDRSRTHYAPCCKHCAREHDSALTDNERETVDTVLKRHAEHAEHELYGVLRRIDAVTDAEKYTSIPLP